MSEPQPKIRVGIGLIGRGGRYLIRRRPPLPGSPMPGVWEFPGGKCEGDESPEATARRECEEETGIAIRIVGLRRVITHDYPHGLIELHYFDAVLAEDASEPDAKTGFLWMDAGELPGLVFPPANGPILEELAAEASRGGEGR